MATASSYFPLASEDPCTSDCGSDGSPDSGSVAGASGSSPGSINISHGAMIAIIVVVAVVAVVGISSSILFYVAKKREWKIRESIRRSARKVVTALTPRRSEFPRSLKDEPGTSRARDHKRLDDVPPTPRLPVDLEKGPGKADKRSSSKADKKRSNFSRK